MHIYLSLCYIQVYISLREYLTFIISLTVRINIAEGIINTIAGTIIIIHQVSWLDSCTTFYNYFSMQMWDYNIHLHISPLMTHTKQLPHLTTTALLRPNTTVNHSSDTAYRRNEEKKRRKRKQSNKKNSLNNTATSRWRSFRKHMTRH